MREKLSLLICRGTATDVPALADLATRTFRDTFEGQNTRLDMEQYLKRSFSSAQLQREFDDPASTFLLASAAPARALIGYAKLKFGEPPPSVKGPNPLELERLYVGREALGHGVGAALMRACLEEAARGGHETLWLGVWEHNPRAIAFYRRWGFEEVDAHTFLLGSDEQIDIIMERAVLASK